MVGVHKNHPLKNPKLKNFTAPSKTLFIVLSAAKKTLAALCRPEARFPPVSKNLALVKVHGGKPLFSQLSGFLGL